MNVKTFQAPSIADALAKVKQDLGPHAVILHTRAFKRGGVMGLGAKNIVEITAGTSVNVQPRKKPLSPRPQPQPSHSLSSRAASATALLDPPDDLPARHPLRSTYGLARPPSRPAPSPAPTTRELAASVLKEPTFELRTEISSLRTMVESLLQRTASSATNRKDLPDSLAKLYTQLLEQQVSDEIAYRVVDDVKAELSPEQLANPVAVRERLTQKLEQMLPSSLNTGPARPITGNKCRSICLIGPTGVGKTTTIAKLAAAFKLRQKQSVGLITIDTYRIAAVDQLRTYANIIGVPLKVVLTPPELVAAIREMAACGTDTILIDTAGRSHTDQLKLNELSGFIAAANPTEVHLVLSSTTTQESMEAAFERFSQVKASGVDQIIFTKLDEAVSFGVLLNVARIASRALSYLTTGQDVPDNIEAGHPRRLARLILGERL